MHAGGTTLRARHVRTLLEEHRKKAAQGFVVCRCLRPAKLAENVTAIPWWRLLNSP